MENRLEIDLFEPGMTPLHRAGLGGLAATIAKFNKDKKLKDIFPGLTYDERKVYLDWTEYKTAKDFFQSFYEKAFDLKDGLIHLPGAYGPVEPRPEVKALLQQGMSFTILQFGPNRESEGPPREKLYRVDDQPMVISHQHIIGYTHRSAWEQLFTKQGEIKPSVTIRGTIAPGFAQRHNAFGTTQIEQSPRHAVALHFALVGTISLTIDRETGVLVIPDVENLHDFVALRGGLIPRSPRECWVSSAADAALRTHLRLLSTTSGEKLGLRRCLVVHFATKSWNKQQKSRSAVLDPDSEVFDRESNRKDLLRFEVAMLELSPTVPKLKPAEVGLARPDIREPVPSLLRPFVATNLALRRKWYYGFRNLLSCRDILSREQRSKQLDFERKGLIEMMRSEWDDSAEVTLVKAIHEAMRCRFRKIAKDSNGDEVTRKNRQKRQLERWRIRFINAKTEDDVRGGLSELWGNAGRIHTLAQSWKDIASLLTDSQRWMLNRDLVILALVSYSPRPSRQFEQPKPAPHDVED